MLGTREKQNNEKRVDRLKLELRKARIKDPLQKNCREITLGGKGEDQGDVRFHEFKKHAAENVG